MTANLFHRALETFFIFSCWLVCYSGWFLSLVQVPLKFSFVSRALIFIASYLQKRVYRTCIQRRGIWLSSDVKSSAVYWRQLFAIPCYHNELSNQNASTPRFSGCFVTWYCTAVQYQIWDICTPYQPIRLQIFSRLAIKNEYCKSLHRQKMQNWKYWLQEKV